MYVPSAKMGTLVREAIQWHVWERIVHTRGYVIDRALSEAHPRYPDIIYPIDYGYIRGTLSSDNEEVDIFVGSGNNGLVGCILTTDFRRRDQEVKFIFNCTSAEIYIINGFINYDMTLMMGRLVLRRPMRELWG